jgi:uncharacterized protein (TIGR00369 family)
MAEETSLPPGAEEISFAGFSRHFGPLYQLPDNGERPCFGFLVEHRHMNSSESVHGGMLMALADIAMSRTTRMATGAATCSTVSLTCDFLSPGKPGDLIEARATITRRTRTMVFLSAEVIAGDRLLLVAQGIWKIGAAQE